MMNKVYIVNETVDLGSHIMKVFHNSNDAEKFKEKEDEKLEKSYGKADIWGNDRIFISEHGVE